MADNSAIIQEIKLILNSDLTSIGQMENALKALSALTKEVNVKDIASKKELEAALAIINKLILQESEGYKIAANSAKELLAINEKESVELSKQNALNEENRQKKLAELNIAHQQANVINQQIDRQNILNARAERHAQIRKTLSNTLHQNANTLERMQHNQTVLNNRLQQTVVGSEQYRNISAQIAVLQGQISAATVRTQIGLKGAFKEATGLQKAFNRIAFVFTAMISYAVLDLGKKIIAGPVKATIEWEDELSKIFTLLDDTEKRFKGMLEGTVKSLVANYGQSLQDASRAVYDILSARFDPQDVEIISRESAKLAIGEFTDIKIAVDAVTTVLNSFSLSAKYAGEAASFIAQMVTDGKTTLEELHTNLGKITSVAASLGFDMRQVGAAFATVTLQGIKTDVAITSLRQLMMRLIDPSTEAAKVISKYGLDLSVASIQAGGFTKVLEEMVGLTEDELLAFAKSKTGAQALFALINSGSKFQEAYNNQLVLSNVHLAKYEDRMNNLGLLTKKVGGETEILAKSVGDTWNPTLKILLISIKAILGFLNKLPGQILAIIPALTILGIKIRTLILEFRTSAVSAIATIKVAMGSVLLAADAAALAIVGILNLFAKVKGKAAEAFLNASSKLLEISTQLRQLNNDINQMEFNDGLIKYNETFGTTLKNEKDLNSELEKQKKLEKESSIAFGEYNKEHKDILEGILNRQSAGKVLNAAEKTFLLEYNRLLLDKNDITQRILTIQNLLNKGLTEEDSKRKDIIRKATDAYEQEIVTFKKSEQELDNLRAKETALNALLKTLKENGSSQEEINNREIELSKLQKKIKQDIISLAKEDLAIADSKYEMSRLTGINIIEQEQNKLTEMKRVLDTLDEGTEKEKLLVQIKQFELQLTRNLADAEERRKNAGVDFNEFGELKQNLFKIGSNGGDFTKWLQEVYNDTKISTEQFKELLALATALNEERDRTKKTSSLKTIFGIPDFQSTADAQVFIEQEMANAIMGIQEAVLQHQLNMIERGKEAKLDALTVEFDAYRDQVSGTLLTDAHRARVLASIAKKEAEKKKQIEDNAAKAMAKKKKENAIAEVAISFAQGLVGIASSTLSAGPLGIPWWVLLTGILTATHAAQLAIIEGTKFATGGISDGPSHTQGGIQMFHKSGAYIGEMEGHEHINSKKATTGREKFLLGQNKAFESGMSPEDFARNYLINKLNTFVPRSSPVDSYQRSYAVGGITQANNGTVVNFSRLEDSLNSQTKELKNMVSRLSAIEKYNREVSENTNSIKRKGRGI